MCCIDSAFESLIIGMVLGSTLGTYIGACFMIRRYYIDLQRQRVDVANITNNILHGLDYEEKGSVIKPDYMTARPVV